MTARGKCNITHGLSKTSEYRIWGLMLHRCRRTDLPSAVNYGARGIKVCPEWWSFENFLRDMGNRPSPEHQIDRINNDGPYSPSNCRWATRTQQARNKRSNRMITIDGRTMCMAEWAALNGLRNATVHRRLKVGWPEFEATHLPIFTRLKK